MKRESKGFLVLVFFFLCLVYTLNKKPPFRVKEKGKEKKNTKLRCALGNPLASLNE